MIAEEKAEKVEGEGGSSSASGVKLNSLLITISSPKIFKAALAVLISSEKCTSILPFSSPLH